MELNYKTKILIVEDEMIVALDIKNNLIKLGFDVVSIVTNYNDALFCIQNNSIEIILMDVNLRDSLDGIQIALEIQKTQYIPIIYLTAFSDDETIQRAIKTNPIAYLTKPFKVDELKSTILLAKFKISQLQEQPDNNLKPIGENYYYNEVVEELYFKKIQIKLTQNERKLLDLLYKSKGKLVSFETIEHTIWEDTTVSNSTLRTLIYRLRGKLEYKLIETTPKVGCKLL